jgi:hypothetical protein
VKHQDKGEELCNSFKNRLGVSEFKQIFYDMSSLIQPKEMPEIDSPFSDEEVNIALKEMPYDHTPGPDGFNGCFMKKCWSIIQSDFQRLLSQFYHQALDFEHINGSFITLIPKKDNPQTTNDYRSISLLNSSLKLLTKLLATRMQSVITSVIHVNQY